jgi:DTW domain-containing protein YfiP
MPGCPLLSTPRPWASIPPHMVNPGETSEAGEQAAGPLPLQVECARCGKPQALCVCEDITPEHNAVELLILQHPQEQDRALGTAVLTALHFKHATLKIGLSWPSLTKILGRTVDPQRWAVLYLGSLKAAEIAPDTVVVVVDRKGQAEANQKAILRGIEGVILLDGNWSQAKALWWRNAWMLKCRRVILAPSAPSRYGRLRREPRADGLSTIEAAAMLMSNLERRPEVEVRLMASFERLLDRYRQLQKTTPGFDSSHEPAKGGRFRGARQRRRRSRRS